MVTLPPMRKHVPSERSASRPRLAAAANREGRSNLFGADFPTGRVASRGRLALRRQYPNAPAAGGETTSTVSIRISVFGFPSDFGIRPSDFFRHSSFEFPSVFGFRPSDFLRISDFGFRPFFFTLPHSSALPEPPNPPASWCRL